MARRNLITRPFYYDTLGVDPNNADTVYVGDEGWFKSTDAGKTFARAPSPHSDNHDVWINPKNSNYMVQGNDGGAGGFDRRRTNVEFGGQSANGGDLSSGCGQPISVSAVWSAAGQHDRDHPEQSHGHGPGVPGGARLRDGSDHSRRAGREHCLRRMQGPVHAAEHADDG